MAKYKVTGKVTKPGLGTVKASKIIDAANESEAVSKAKNRWQTTYDNILNNGREIDEITVIALQAAYSVVGASSGPAAPAPTCWLDFPLKAHAQIAYDIKNIWPRACIK